MITFGKEMLENKQILYEGLVIETSNAQNAMFSFKTPIIVTQWKYFKANKYQKHQYLHGL